MFSKNDYERPEMESVDIFGFLPLCASQEGYDEGDEGGWLDGED
jgi:hypothetical protein